MATWSNGGNTNLLRKMLFGSVYAVDYSSANATSIGTFITSGPVSSAGIGTLTPFGSSVDLGTTTDDGVVFAASVSGDDVTSWQTREVVRHDITSDVSTANVKCLETRASVLSLYNNLPLASGISASGQMKYSKPPAGTVYRSMLFLGVDTAGVGGEVYGAVLYPKCSVTDKADISWHPGDPVTYDMTITAYPDPLNSNITVYTWFDGPGMPASH